MRIFISVEKLKCSGKLIFILSIIVLFSFVLLFALYLKITGKFTFRYNFAAYLGDFYEKVLFPLMDSKYSYMAGILIYLQKKGSSIEYGFKNFNEIGIPFLVEYQHNKMKQKK